MPDLKVRQFLEQERRAIDRIRAYSERADEDGASWCCLVQDHLVPVDDCWLRLALVKLSVNNGVCCKTDHSVGNGSTSSTPGEVATIETLAVEDESAIVWSVAVKIPLDGLVCVSFTVSLSPVSVNTETVEPLTQSPSLTMIVSGCPARNTLGDPLAFADPRGEVRDSMPLVDVSLRIGNDDLASKCAGVGTDFRQTQQLKIAVGAVETQTKLPGV
eukprot:3934447-Rhodomonas_salina.1